MKFNNKFIYQEILKNQIKEYIKRLMKNDFNKN